jgi:hypothetical protein
VVVARDLDTAVALAPDRLVDTAVTELELESLRA